MYGKCPKILYIKVSDRVAYANSADPDQTATEWAVLSGSTLFAIPLNILTFTTLWAFSADNKLMIFFLFFPENRIRHFMQIVSLGDNLHEMSNPVFWEK